MQNSQKKTQYARIKELCSDGEFHCQSEFHPITWSPHKRRKEIELSGAYTFLERPCEHGIPRSKDYKMIPNAPISEAER